MQRSISEQGIALIKQCEGFAAKPYRCPAGKLTIGYGHMIQAEENLQEVSAEQALCLLLQDIKATEEAINRLVTALLSQNQFDALVSLVYNIGIHAFENSTLLKLLNAQNPAASQEFGRWVYINGLKSPGLAYRRALEAALFCQ